MQIPWGTPYRSYRNLPPELTLRKSLIPGAGLGVFANTFIRKYTWLGEYEGEVTSVEDDYSEYTFAVWTLL